MADLTKTREDIQIRSVRELVAEGSRDELIRLFATKNPIDIAEEAEGLNEAELREAVYLLPSARLAELVDGADDAMRLRIADTLDDNHLLMVLGHLPDDDASDIMNSLKPERVGRLLAGMRAADCAVLSRLLQYPEESAGSLMTTSFLAVCEDRTVGDCLALIRAKGGEVEQIQTIFVLRMDGSLVGYLDLRRILSSARGMMVKALMETRVVSIDPYADQEQAAELVARYDLNLLPVMSGGQLLGVITVDDIVDVIIEEYDEDLLHLAGTSREESLATPLLGTVRMRLPWLLVNLLTAFLASAVVRAFEGTIEQVVALSAIMTIVSGMGGNAGSQTMAIVVRHLSRNDITLAEGRRALGKEVSAGIIDGTVNGLVTGAVVAVLYGNPWLSIVVLAAMVGNTVIAGVSGFLVPVALKACGQDPAVASSIFVTTATDVLGFLLFLGLAQALMPLLV